MKKLIALFCLSAFPNLALAADCAVPYSEFEANIPHIDMADCPANQPNADDGFCRLVLDGDYAYVYVFLYTDEEPCLSAIEEARKSDYLMRR